MAALPGKTIERFDVIFMTGLFRVLWGILTPELSNYFKAPFLIKMNGISPEAGLRALLNCTQNGKDLIETACEKRLFKIAKGILEIADKHRGHLHPEDDSFLIQKAACWAKAAFLSSDLKETPYYGSLLRFSSRLMQFISHSLRRAPQSIETPFQELFLFFFLTEETLSESQDILEIFHPNLLFLKYKAPFMKNEATLLEIAIYLNKVSLVSLLTVRMEKDEKLKRYYEKHVTLNRAILFKNTTIFFTLFHICFKEDLLVPDSLEAYIPTLKAIQHFLTHLSKEYGQIYLAAHELPITPIGTFPQASFLEKVQALSVFIQKKRYEMLTSLIEASETNIKDLPISIANSQRKLSILSAEKSSKAEHLEKIRTNLETLQSRYQPEIDEARATFKQAKQAEEQAQAAADARLSPLQTRLKECLERKETLEKELRLKKAQLEKQRHQQKTLPHQHAIAMQTLDDQIESAEAELKRQAKKLSTLQKPIVTNEAFSLAKQKAESLRQHLESLQKTALSKEATLSQMETQLQQAKDKEGPFRNHLRENGPRALGTQELGNKKPLTPTPPDPAVLLWRQKIAERPRVHLAATKIMPS